MEHDLRRIITKRRNLELYVNAAESYIVSFSMSINLTNKKQNQITDAYFL